MNSSTRHQLEEEWLYHCRQMGADSNAAIRWKHYLFKEYERPGRYYHSLNHISQVLEIAKKYRAEFSAWNNVFFAIWFHDIVQKYGIDNERQSAQLSRLALTELGADQPTIDHVYQMILASKNHDTLNNNDCALFIDCDLSILGTSQQAYHTYSSHCRLEYPVPDFIYRKGRRKFLTHMLNKQHIYQTCLLREPLEVSARINMTNELSALGS